MSEQPPKPAEPSSRDARKQPSTVLERLRAKGVRGERYSSRDEIARGGMGVIVRVWDTELQRHLAMKVMLGAEGDAGSSASAAASEGRRVARFLDEAHITGQLDHPGIVPVHEIGLDERGQLFFTMRLIKGRELREVFELVHKGDEDWNLTRALGVVLKVCEAMAFAHEKGVIHRDLKPANVMVGRFGEVYVMDWGLAKVLDTEDKHDIRIAKPDVSHSIVRTARAGMDATPESPLSTMDGDIVGTPCYMAPEQARGRVEDIGPHSDVYSVGSMLYELLSGEKPYCVDGVQPTPSAVLGALMHGAPRALATIKKNIPDELVAIAEKAMARDPRDRYPSMLGMAEDLRAFLEGRVVKAYKTGPVAEFKKWIARNRAFATAVAAALLIALVGVFVAFSLQRMANVDLAVAKSQIEDRNRNLQDSERQTRHAYDQLRAATEEQERINQALQAMTAQAQTNASLAQRRGYAASLAAAEASLRFHDAADARLHLDKCEPELRGWEWQHLNSRCDDSTRVFDGEGAMSVVTATRDGRVIAYAFERNGSFSVQLLDGRSGEKLRSLGGFENPVLALAFDAAGKRLASTSLDRQVRVFDVESGKSIGAWSERTGLTSSLAIAADGAHVFVVANDEVPRLYEAESGKPVREYAKLPGRAIAACFAPDGERVAAATRDGVVLVFDTASGALLATLGHHEAPIWAIAFDAEGERLLTGGGHSTQQQPASGTPPDHALRVWNSRTGELLSAWPGHEQAVCWVAFGESGHSLLSTSLDGTVNTFDLGSGESHSLIGHTHGIVAAARFGDARHVITAGEDGKLRVWEPDLADVLTSAPQRGEVIALAFGRDGKLVVAGHDEGLVCAYDARTGFVRWQNTEFYTGSMRIGGQQLLRSLATSPADGRVAIGGATGAVFVVTGDTGDSIARLATDESESVASLAFSLDGKRLATGTSLGTIRIFDLATNKVERTLRGAKSTIRALAWSSDGKRLASLTTESVIALWDVESETSTELAHDRGSRDGCLEFDRGSGRLISCSAGLVRVFDGDFGASVTTLAAPDSVAAAFLGDGRRFASCNAPGTIVIHDTERAERLLTLRRDASQATALACEQSGHEIAAGFADGAIRLWSSQPLGERREVRTAALRARDLALPLVDAMITRGSTHEAALAEVRDNDSISEALREAATSYLNQCFGRAQFLRDESWAIARRPNLSAAEYQLALWQSLTLQLQQPEDYRGEFVEGAARYRMGQYERAEERLKRAMSHHTARRFEPEMAGFLALTELALGRPEAAEAPLAELRSLMTVGINARAAENIALLQEVEDQVERHKAR